MQLLEASPHLRPAQRVLYGLFALLFLISPFYYQDNLGGEGLSLPFNSVIWVPVLLIIGAALAQVLNSGRWVRPRYLWLLILFPSGIVLGGFISGLERSGEWMVRLGVLVGGMLFWFSLLQFRFTRRDRENLLYLLLASFLMHAMVGVMQLAPQAILSGWIPVANQKLLGMFQQPNLQASLMATAIALSLYLASTPGYRAQRWPLKALVLLTLVLATLGVVGSGSRVGLLGAALSLTLLLLARGRIWWRQKGSVLLVAALLLGGGLGYQVSDGSLQAYSKLERLAEAGADARPHIYRIALDVFERSPWVGHGIGSFQREFQNERAVYAQTHDASPIAGEPRFSHPHNELLFWADEGGLLALASIALGALAVILQLVRLGFQRGVATAALLLPIVLHTQVELPFYISTLHWLVLLVLLYVTFATGSSVKRLGLSGAMQRLLLGSSLLLIPGLTIFLTHALLSQTGVMQFIKARGTQPEHLTPALNNLYFREMGEYFIMRNYLYSGLVNNTAEPVEAFIQWGEGFVHQLPDIQIFQDLAVAYQFMDQEEKSIRLLARARAMYPGNQSLKAAAEKLANGQRLFERASSASASDRSPSQAQP